MESPEKKIQPSDFIRVKRRLCDYQLPNKNLASYFILWSSKLNSPLCFAHSFSQLPGSQSWVPNCSLLIHCSVALSLNSEHEISAVFLSVLSFHNPLPPPFISCSFLLVFLNFYLYISFSFPLLCILLSYFVSFHFFNFRLFYFIPCVALSTRPHLAPRLKKE